MNVYESMIKPLVGKVLNNLSSPDRDEQLVEFLIGGITGESMWQLREEYIAVLFRIKVYHLAVLAGGKGTEYKKFVGNSEYYAAVVKTIDKRFAEQSASQCEDGLAFVKGGETAKAVECFLAAADKFSCDGCLYYAAMMLDAEDIDEAVFRYRMAADMGSGAAMYNLALCYKNGAGTDSNVSLATVWLARSFLAGEQSAKELLVEIYKYGDGIDTNFERAYKLSKGSKEEAEKVAMEIIGDYY